MSVPILRTRAELRATVADWQASGTRIGVVPTMGALHAGHLSLVARAEAECERVVVTLFVNPRQFDSAADLAAYPRTETRDAEILGPFAVDALYVPEAEAIYPPGFATTVSVGGLTDVLCGAHRPGHFDGVATVVAKLLLQTGADRAYFGEKDYQQLMVVRRMAADLDLRTQVVACETVRDPDGLALSSRNARLSAAARTRAAELPREMAQIADRLRRGAPLDACLPGARAHLAAAGFGEIEYLELRAADDLAPLARADRPARLFAAAWIDGVRLIDNIAV